MNEIENKSEAIQNEDEDEGDYVDIDQNELPSNEELYNKYNIGDHLKVKRFGGIYSHHGIYLGDAKVVHLTGGIKQGIPVLSGGNGSASIQIDDIKVFENGDKSIVVNKFAKKDKKNIEDLLICVESKLGDNIPYNIILNNCEHFANELSIKTRKSQQVKVFSVSTGIGSFFMCISILSAHTLNFFTIIPVIFSSLGFIIIQKLT